MTDGSLTLYATFSPLDALVAVPMLDYTTVGGDPIPVLTPGEQDWEGIIAEAPFVVERDGRFHLMYSGNRTYTRHYAVGAAVADSPTGPFVRYANNPILSSDPDLDIFGPGHNAVVQGPDGQDLIVYHAKIRSGPGFNRRIFVGEVSVEDDRLRATLEVR